MADDRCACEIGTPLSTRSHAHHRATTRRKGARFVGEDDETHKSSIITRAMLLRRLAGTASLVNIRRRLSQKQGPFVRPSLCGRVNRGIHCHSVFRAGDSHHVDNCGFDVARRTKMEKAHKKKKRRRNQRRRWKLLDEEGRRSGHVTPRGGEATRAACCCQ